MQVPYRFLEGLTYADYAFEAFGASLDELFRNSGYALMSSMVEISTVKPAETREVKLHSHELEQLLFDFLEEFIFLKDAETFLACEIDVNVSKDKDRYSLTATLKGEEIDTKKHVLHSDVKSVTYHLFKVEQKDHGWRAQVILDV
ncbi:MAG TPA: archease [Candidatus Nanoarchaeia archaeon]|nr:archease [Candidatus Nanoarchaeia archaeon]